MSSPYECSVHTHSTLCDGKGTPEEMAAAAYAAGVKYYGFSGHSFSPNPADFGYNLPPDTTEYRKKVLSLREEYAGRMDVLLGIEWDSWTAGAPEGYDYWIGSVHALRDAEGGYYAVDASPEVLRDCIGRVFGGDAYAMTDAYYKAVAEMAARKPDILGHIDLVTKYSEKHDFFDADAPRYRKAALDAVHAIDPAATLLEINTGAMSRGWRTTPYPARFILEAWREMGGRVVITADTHHPDTILYAYDTAIAAAYAAGFRACTILTARGWEECPLPRTS